MMRVGSGRGTRRDIVGISKLNMTKEERFLKYVAEHPDDKGIQLLGTQHRQNLRRMERDLARRAQ